MNDGVIGALSAAELSPLLKLYFWGIDLIRAIQTIESPALTAIMKAITALGTELFYLPVLLCLFWCVDEKKGIRCAFVFLLSAALNVFMKDLLKQPRPFDFEPALGLVFESSYGIPSGHAQLSLTFWGFLASWLSSRFARRRRLVWACAIGIMLLIAFTRLYLGVHFPTDILAGWFLGILVLILYRVLEPRVTSLFDRDGSRYDGTRARMIGVAALVLLLNTLGVDVMLGGVILGLGAGYNLCLKHAPFSARAAGKWPRYALLALRYLLGVIGAAAIALFLRLVLPGEHTLFVAIPAWGVGSPYTSLAKFLLAGALGLWAGFGAPWCFLRTGLAQARDDAPR
jgi:membrane-associated phospholipid phosphatase